VPNLKAFYYESVSAGFFGLLAGSAVRWRLARERS